MLRWLLILACLINISAFSNEIKKVDFMKARITYGKYLPIGVGSVDVYLMVDAYNDIVSLNVHGNIGVLGVTEELSEEISIGRLLRGESLEFGMRGSTRDILEIEPSRDFSITGGDAVLKIWNGSQFKKENIRFTKTSKGYQAYKISNSGSKKIITGLSINMRGYNISKMYVGKYELKTN